MISLPNSNHTVLYKGINSRVLHFWSEREVVSLRSKRGSFGSGWYFSCYNTSFNYADEVAEQVLGFHVAITNPLKVDVSFEPGWERDYDTAALPLLQVLFTESEIQQILKDTEDALFDCIIENRVREKGYDGLIVFYDGDASVFETVAYDVSQLKLTQMA